jgi:hypothetical protein
MIDTNQIKVGHRLLDNDPRMDGRKLEVTQVALHYVVAVDLAGYERTYKASRIFPRSGGPRRSGLTHLGY